MIALKLAPAEFKRFARALSEGGEATVLLVSYKKFSILVELPKRWAKPNPPNLNPDGTLYRRSLARIRDGKP